jgi:dynein heavy chain
MGTDQAQQPPNKSPPWDAIRYLVSDVTYGGRVTDDWDRRLLNVYANDFFNDKIIFEDNHKIGDHPKKPCTYYIFIYKK